VIQQTSGELRREKVKVCPAVIAPQLTIVIPAHAGIQ